MPYREDFILFNVLNNEVVFEEYFCNLLKDNNFRSLFIKFIDSEVLNKEIICYNYFSTEKTLPKKYGRADLFLKITNKEFIFEIKNKNKTGLTENQPTNYLEYLKEVNFTSKFDKYLFFLVPREYEHKEIIMDRWEDCSNYSRASIEKQIFYWQDLIIAIRDEKLEQNNIEIEMFCDFCDYWFDMKPVVFTNQEKELFKIEGSGMNEYNNMSIPKLMQKLENLTRNIGINAGMQEDTDVLGFNYSIEIEGYTILFGIDYDVWEEKKVPLNITIQNNNNGYQYFELELLEIKLQGFYYKETSLSEESFAYIIDVNDKIDSKTYQKTVIDTILKIKTQLIKK